MRRDDACGFPRIAALDGIDDVSVLGDKLGRVAAFDGGDADANKAVGLLDQVAQRLPTCGCCRKLPQSAVECAVIVDELRTAVEDAKSVQRRQCLVARILGGFDNTGRFQNEAEAKDITRVGNRNRVHPISLTGMHRNEPFTLKTQ